MASTLNHTVTYPFSTTRYWEIITNEQYWRDLLQIINSSHGELVSFALDGDTVTVEMKQGIPEDKLPSMITKVRPGDLEIPRRNEFTRNGDTISGTMTASVTGAPATVEATVSVTGDPAAMQYSGSANVSIPFVGGKIEKAVIDELTKLLDAEHDETVTWKKAGH